MHPPSGIVNYFRGAFWATGSSVLGMFISLAIIMVAARALSKEELGAFFLVLLIVQFASVFGDIGLRNAAIRFISAEKEGREVELTQYLVTINLFVSLVVCLVLIVILPFLTQLWEEPAVGAAIWYGVPLALLSINYQLGSSILAGYSKFKQMSVVSLSIGIIRMILSIGALYLGFGVAGLLISLLIANAIGIYCVLRIIPAPFVFRFQLDRSKEVLVFGGWLYGSSLISVIHIKLGEIMLTTFLGTAALSIYTTAMQIPGMLQKVFEAVRPVILSYVSALAYDKNETLITTTRLLSALLAMGAVVLIAIGHPLVIFIFSSKYEAAVPILQLLCFWVVIGLVNYYIAITLMGRGLTKSVFFLSIPQLLSMSFFSYILIPDQGGFGAASALCLSSLTGNIVACLIISKADWRLFCRLSVAYLRSIIPLSIIVGLVIWTQPPTLVSLLYSLIMIASLFFLKAITFEDLLRIRKQLSLGKGR